MLLEKKEIEQLPHKRIEIDVKKNKIILLDISV